MLLNMIVAMFIYAGSEVGPFHRVGTHHYGLALWFSDWFHFALIVAFFGGVPLICALLLSREDPSMVRESEEDNNLPIEG
jgi:hypothetical protein